jgi:hypothetical protein
VATWTEGDEEGDVGGGWGREGEKGVDGTTVGEVEERRKVGEKHRKN